MENFEETKPEETTPDQDPGNEMETLIVTEDIRSYIYETAKWAKFLSIVGFVISGLMVVISLSIGALMSSIPAALQQSNILLKFGSGFITVLYLLIAIIYFYPSLLIFKYANSAKKAILFADQASLSIAMGKMKSLFKFWGIITIVGLAFYFIAVLFVIAAGVGASHLM